MKEIHTTTRSDLKLFIDYDLLKLIMKLDNNGRQVTSFNQVDLWSLGVLTYEFLVSFFSLLIGDHFAI